MSRSPLIPLLVALAPSTVLAQITPFSDDFETGTLLTTDTPAGQWSLGGPVTAGCSINATPAAAHRGTYGLRVVDQDTSATGQIASLHRSENQSGNVYLRYWQRTTSTAAGEFVSAQFCTTLLPNNSVADLSSSFHTYIVGGASGGVDGGWAGETSDAGFEDGQWHLFELAVEGVGSASSTRRTWVDGVLRTTGTGLDFSGITSFKYTLGEPWSDIASYEGTLDFDDYRIGPTAQASTLALLVDAGSLLPGACLPLSLALVSSVDGGLAPAPYPVTAQLAWSGTDGGFFADAACAQPTSEVIIPSNSPSATVYAKALAPGAAVVSASNVDFLSSPSGLGVASEGPAGPGAGTVRPGEFRVGCGCRAGQESPLLMAILALLLRAVLDRRG